MNRKRAKRSLWTVAEVIVFLLLSLNGWLRLQQAVSYWSILEQLKLYPSGLYLAITGGLMGLSGLAAGLVLWFRRPGADWVALAVAVTWLAMTWVERLALAATPAASSNWPFMLGVTILALIAVGLPVIRRPRNSAHDPK